MKGTLIKLDQGWMLLIDNVIHATDKDKLSLKNCQAIEDGYDLDELSESHAEEMYSRNENDYNELASFENRKRNFEEGFQKAMEILGEKNYSEKDLMKAYNCNHISSKQKEEYWGDFIQSLQPKEWEVEIEMICPHPEDTYVCGMQYGCDEDGCNHPNQIPYLDKDGCLILRKL